MKKSILLIIGLVFLNACAEYSALVGPSYTLAKSGSIVQTGNVYATSYVVKKATGQSPGEFVISLAKNSSSNPCSSAFILYICNKSGRLLKVRIRDCCNRHRLIAS